jgi:hypothetical protein
MNQNDLGVVFAVDHRSANDGTSINISAVSVYVLQQASVLHIEFQLNKF